MKPDFRVAGDEHATSNIGLAYGMSAMNYARKVVFHATMARSLIKTRAEMDKFEERIISHRESMLTVTDMTDMIEEAIEVPQFTSFDMEAPQPDPFSIENLQPTPSSIEAPHPTSTTTSFFGFNNITRITFVYIGFLAFYYRHEIRIIGRAVVAGAHLVIERWEQRQCQILHDKEAEARIKKDEQEAGLLLNTLAQTQNVEMAHLWQETQSQEMRDMQDLESRSPSWGTTISESSWDHE
ncbi:hypothetical protein CFE70_003442 [Pyrenophora teres f. teres 0-1]|uniref:Uncharacterized protein n=2 Tax=Pyrenophora teres f. teres TaxID=97479 RepID=E3S1J5_PYRTT|nr:hypothetical protein PTT_16093 [Pyrenophora teres f. teres 0-1]KAE8846088.1 hypothetical protein HRS9139_00655 [Pyrenophora teres f. teres]KAE8848229.1 hypothetical protein PTNB85_02072 [Pyrenophora teres f. teres]KAE8853606.1 hypothetical protein HRS9122_00598 [Pyrenophora teres f. teres]KAE8868153.1 hypothetical protein PTNB29_02064 [Pyrenophora teres f. teres]